jgi:hypothetical protein
MRILSLLFISAAAVVLAQKQEPAINEIGTANVKN